MIRTLPTATLILSLAGFVTAPATAQEDPERRQRPRASAQRVQKAPKIDGLLDEAVWTEAVPIGELTQVEPIEGVPPSEASEIRFLYDEDHLYVGIRFFDSEPRRLVSNSKERDANFQADDRFELVIDTFLDRRNAFFFQMNPAGSKGDALITGNGSDFNKPWDGIWEGKTNIDALGWTAELAIPFKTLSFKQGLDTWGLNIERYIGRKNESSRWSGARQDVRTFNIFEAGNLEGLEGMRQGAGLDVKPFFVSNWLNEREDDDKHLLGDYGFDAFYKITSNLTLSMTVNTDFAETEVDERQINLTRFPLFFPERRDFFLQDAGLFEFANLGNDLIPFFSRTIGLSDDGEEIPILVGAKVTGQAGDYNIGVLDVQTDSVDDIDDKNLFVTRLARNVGEQSSLGMIFTNGNPTEEADNHTYGLDANYRTSSFNGDKVLVASAWMMQSYTEDDSGDNLAFGASAGYPNDLWNWSTSFKEIQENFDPALGFVPRSGIRKYNGELAYEPRIDEFFRQLHFAVETTVITDTDDELESSSIEFQPLGIDWDSGDELRVEAELIQENLTENFDILEDITIPVDDYDYERYRIEYESARKRQVYFDVELGTGGFFDGDRTDYGVALGWQPSASFTGSVEYEQNDVKLDDGDFSTSITRLRLGFYFTPDLSWSSFVQWDSVSDTFGINSRVRWIQKPGNELFFVFNETLQYGDDSLSPLIQDVALKLVYTIRF